VGLTRTGILTTARLRRNRRIGYFVVACIAVALPGVDPVTTTLEGLPLAALYEMSIWLSVLLDRRAARARAAAAVGT
jgi:Sec-independent protein secretion pathway component TatC